MTAAHGETAHCPPAVPTWSLRSASMHSRVPTPGTHPLEASAALRMDKLRDVRRPQPRGFAVGANEVQVPAPPSPASPVGAA